MGSKLNYKQISLIVLALIGLGLFFGGGIHLPTTHPVNIALYIILILIVIILAIIILTPRYCPKCGAKLPKIRKPQDENEALYGWSTCPKCKTQIDTKGNIVKK